MRLKTHTFNFWLIPTALLLFAVGFSAAFLAFPRVSAGDTSVAEATPTHEYFVTIYDEGEKLIVRTTAATVGELLTRLDFTYSADDVIEPGLDTAISSDNFFINIFRARPVLLKEGLVAKYVMTAARDTRSIFEDAGFTIYDDDKISALPQSDIMEIGLSETFTITRGQTYADIVAAREAAARAEAEAKAQAEAEAAAAAAREAAAKAYSVRPEWSTCADYARQAGVAEDDLGAALTLIYRESGCRVNAENAYSGAYGIPQALPGYKMATAGDDWQTNPITQIRWMITYVNGRYGGWAGALEHSDTLGWY